MAKYLTIPKNFSAADYYRFNKLNKIIQEILINKKINEECVIVDIGCGDGQFLKYIKESCSKSINFKFIGIDKYVNNKSFNFILFNDDVEEEISVEDNSADIVIAAEIIEHIKNTDKLISEIKRILKPDGVILITTPNLASYFNRFLLLLGYQPYHAEVSDVESGLGLGIVYKILGRPKIGNKTAGHLRIFTFKALKDFIEFHGLKLVKYYPVYFSSFRKNNKKKFIIKLFFLIDKIISKLFPTLATGLIIQVKK